MNNVVAIILAGGKSTRFWPLSEKNLINFVGFNLLDYHFKSLVQLGILDFIVVCTPEIAAYLRVKDKSYKGITINRLIQPENQRGIGQAVSLALRLVKNKYSKHKLYIINSDDVYEQNIHKDVILKSNKTDAVFAVGREVESYKPLGYFILNQNKIKGIIEKPDQNKMPSKVANMSLHLFPNYEMLDKFLNEELKKNDENDDSYERAFTKICQNYSTQLISYSGDWCTLKYPWDTLMVTNYFLKKFKTKISDRVKIEKTARISGTVIIEDDVKILDYARILGPTIIKKGTVIGTGAMIRDSIIGENCVVGYHTEITRSYIGNNCWFHTNYIGDSVLANNVNMGAGAILANLRLDQGNIHSSIKENRVNSGRNKFGSIIGNNSQIGVQAAIMPGIKIGKNSIVGPSVVLSTDLEDNSAIYSKQTIFKKKINRQSTDPSRSEFRDLLKI